MRLLSRTSLLLKHLRVERGPALVVFVVVLIASFLLAAVPRFYNQTLDSELQNRLANAPAARRNIVATVYHRLPFYNPDLAHKNFEERAEKYVAGLSPDLQDLIYDHHLVITMPETTVLMNQSSPDPPFVRRMNLRYQSDIDQHITYIEGEAPRERNSIDVTGASDWFPLRDTVSVPGVEIALSRDSADTLALGTGEVALVQLLGNNQIFAVYVSGIFEIADPDSDYWLGDRSLASPVQIGFGDTATGEAERSVSTALFSLDGYRNLTTLTDGMEIPGSTTRAPGLPIEYKWSFAIDPGVINTGNYRTVLADMGNLRLTFGPYVRLANTPVRNVSLTNDLGNILGRFDAQSQFAVSVVGVIIVSVLATVLASIAVMATLTAERSVERSGLIRGRGASSGQMAAGRLVEALVVCLPAGVIGWLTAVALVEGRASRLSLLLPLATVLLTLLLVLLANRRNLFTDLGELLGRRSAVPVITEQRRIVIELFVVAMAIGGIVLLRRRGLAPTGEAELDPMLAAVPVLLMLAVGVVVLRLHPLMMSLAARLVRRRTDVVPFVALRSAAARPPSAHLPLLVMVLAIGVASFALVTWRSLDAIQWGAVWVLNESGQYVESFNPEDGAIPPSPLAEGVRRSLMLGSVIAMAHAVLAILVALILGAAARRREVGFLRTIGLSSRQTAALTAFEYLPMLILACPAGLVFGVVAARLVESTMDLGAATGSETPVSIAIPWLEIALIPAMLTLCVGLVVIAFTVIARRTQLTALTRIGDR